MGLKLAVVADDSTGATDAAGMAAESGLRTLFVPDGTRSPDQYSQLGMDVLVVGTQSRSVDPTQAYTTSELVYRNIAPLKPGRVQFKICSTFDSTRAGNIGQGLDAALAVFGFTSAFVVPALPVNGRTTYMGHHFVHAQLLSESSLKDHPLNPMTDPNLVRWLGFQTEERVGLLSLPEILKGAETMRERRQALERESNRYIIADAVIQKDIDDLVRAFPDDFFWCGSSGATLSLARLLSSGKPPMHVPSELGMRTLVISGSMSVQSGRQLDDARASGFTMVPLDIAEASPADWSPERTLAAVESAYARGNKVAVYLEQGTPERSIDVRPEVLNARVGELAALIVERCDPARIVVAGGETSGAVCRACNFDAFVVGKQISPGVPLCFPTDDPEKVVVLKSGNFGAADLYERIASLQCATGSAAHPFHL